MNRLLRPGDFISTHMIDGGTGGFTGKVVCVENSSFNSTFVTSRAGTPVLDITHATSNASDTTLSAAASNHFSPNAHFCDSNFPTPSCTQIGVVPGKDDVQICTAASKPRSAKHCAGEPHTAKFCASPHTLHLPLDSHSAYSMGHERGPG